MEYAVIETGGKQYKVSSGTILEVERLAEATAGKTISFDKVLLFVTDGQVRVGMPYVSGVSVAAKVLTHFRGEKIRVAKFRAKSKYRRMRGHRQELSRIEIQAIEGGLKNVSQQSASTKVRPSSAPKSVTKRTKKIL